MTMTTSEDHGSPAWFDADSMDPLIKPLVPLFVKLNGERVAGLRQALVTVNREEMRRIAHTVKGSAASYGFAPVAAIAAAIEDALRSDDGANQLPGLIEELASMQEAMLAAVQRDPTAYSDA